VIITCRTQYFYGSYQDWFMPKGSSLFQPEKFNEIHFVPFD